MQILNGKKSTLMFKLDNGELMQIAPGTLSKSFIPSAHQVQSILSLGSPNEIAIILSSSYEMTIMNQLNASFSYLQPNEKTAREFLFDGKEPELDVVSPETAEILKLKEAALEKDKTINELTEALKKANEEIANSPLQEYMNKAKLAEEKVEKSETALNKLDAELKTANDKLIDSQRQISALTSKVAEAESKLKDANDKLVASVSAEDINALKAENEQLKKDGAIIVGNYNKAKDALVTVMKQFNISYVNGNYVMADLAKGEPSEVPDEGPDTAAE